MKKIIDLLKDVDYKLIKGSIDCEIKDIKDNSNKIEEGDLFIAVIGTTTDSHKFIPDAINKGARVIVVEKDIEIQDNVTIIKVNSSRKALAIMSAAYFDYPAKRLTTIGITGTCGKTSTSYIIKSMLEECGLKVGIIGTICAMIGDKEVETHNTTPNSYEVQKLFCKMVEAGCKYAVMEVSSQGLKMDRVAGIEFDYGVFTNLSIDHIGPNEHENFEEYLYCKSLLFKQCKVGIINTDSDNWKKVIENATCKIIKYGLNNTADIKASNIKYIMNDDFIGVEFLVSGKIDSKFRIDIPGKFSVYNALCAITVASELGIDVKSMRLALEKVKVIGRMELASYNEKYKLIIDYAHNKDEMDNLMDTISEYKPKRLVCIFGGGGNRAKSRRYDMGEISGKWADLTILTEDNPRFEDIESINNDIVVGINKYNGKYIFIKDRKEAIKSAMKNAQKGDIILLIGKGHEKYQEIKGIKYPWDERKAVEEAETEIKKENKEKLTN